VATKGQFAIPEFNMGWSVNYTVPVSYLAGFSYDATEGIMYAIYPQNQFDVFLKANNSLAQALSIANVPATQYNPVPRPDSIYQNQMMGALPQCILCENGSPLLCENGDFLVIT